MPKSDSKNDTQAVPAEQLRAPLDDPKRGFSFAQLRNLVFGEKNQDTSAGLSPAFLKEQQKAIQTVAQALQNYAQFREGARAQFKALEPYRTAAPDVFGKAEQIINASLHNARQKVKTIVDNQAPAISLDKAAAKTWADTILLQERNGAQRLAQPQLLEKFDSQLDTQQKTGLLDATTALYAAREAQLRTQLAEAALDVQINEKLGNAANLGKLDTAAKNLETFLSQTQQLRPSAVPKDYLIEKSLQAANKLIGDQPAIAAQIQNDSPKSLDKAQHAIKDHAQIVEGVAAYKNDLAPYKDTNNAVYDKTIAALNAVVEDSKDRTEKILQHHFSAYKAVPKAALDWTGDQFSLARNDAKNLPQEQLKEHAAAQLRSGDRGNLLQLSQDLKKTAETSLPAPGTNSERKDGAKAAVNARQQDTAGDDLIARIRAGAQKQSTQNDTGKPLEPTGKHIKELTSRPLPEMASVFKSVTPADLKAEFARRGTKTEQNVDKALASVPARATAAKSSSTSIDSLSAGSTKGKQENPLYKYPSPNRGYRYQPGTPTNDPLELARRTPKPATIVDRTPNNLGKPTLEKQSSVKSIDSFSASQPKEKTIVKGSQATSEIKPGPLASNQQDRGVGEVSTKTAAQPRDAKTTPQPQASNDIIRRSKRDKVDNGLPAASATSPVRTQTREPSQSASKPPQNGVNAKSKGNVGVDDFSAASAKPAAKTRLSAPSQTDATTPQGRPVIPTSLNRNSAQNNTAAKAGSHQQDFMKGATPVGKPASIPANQAAGKNPVAKSATKIAVDDFSAASAKPVARTQQSAPSQTDAKTPLGRPNPLDLLGKAIAQNSTEATKNQQAENSLKGATIEGNQSTARANQGASNSAVPDFMKNAEVVEPYDTKLANRAQGREGLGR